MPREKQAGMAFLPTLAEDFVPGAQEKGSMVSGGDHPASWLAELAHHMRTEGAEVSLAAPDALAAEARMARALAERDTATEAAWRGMLALALLWDSWTAEAGGARLTVEAFDSASPLAAAALDAMEAPRRAEGLRVLALHGPDGQSIALGLVNRRTLLAPAAAMADLSPWLPARVTWYDRARRCFLDPCGCLGEADRARLRAQLRLLGRLNAEKALGSPLYDPRALLAAPLGSFLAALDSVAEGERQAILSGEEDAMAALTLRLKAVCGLLPEKDFPHLTCRAEHGGGALGENPLAGCFLGAACAAGADTAATVRRTYLWRGVPFARESAALGLEPAHYPGEADALAEIRDEVALLEANSPRWQKNLAARLDEWLQARQGGALLPAARQAAEDARIRALEGARVPCECAALAWPWRWDSGAVRLLLREALGTSWADAAATPFADGLVVLTDCPADALGDAVLRQSCPVRFAAEGLPACAAVPPLSPALARALAEDAHGPEAGNVSLLTDSLCFTHRALAEEREEIEAAFTLRGAGDVRFTRAYAGEEICALAPAETPTVAVWPCIPFAGGRWTRYYVYAHQAGGVTVEALSHGRWKAGEKRSRAASGGEAAWAVQATEAYPAYLLLRRGEMCLGALPNLLPPFAVPAGESAVIAVDFGATGTAVMLRQGGRVTPLGGPTLVRMLLRGACAPLAEEFLPAAPLSPVMPSAANVYADAPADGSRPLLDGHIHQPDDGDGEAGALLYDLPWCTEPGSDRARRLYLAQVMETACLAALSGGAPDVSWRVSLPDAMAAEGRGAFCRMMNDLARETAQATGLPLTPGVPPVGFAPKSVAAGTYFRAREEMNLRGGFVMLDVGGSGAELALWLRGVNRPVGGCSLPLGVQLMLLDTLMAQPQALAEDFAGLEDENIQAAVARLAGQLALCQGSPRALQRSRLLLDSLLGEHLEALTRWMTDASSRGHGTLTQALLQMHFAFLLMLAGQLLEQAYHDSTLNDRLPGRMEVCLAGRGARLLLAMDEGCRRRLAGFLRLAMSADHPIRELPLLASPAPKLEAACGLLRMAEVDAQVPGEMPRTLPDALSTAPADMLARFLWHFRTAFPDAAARLFGGWFDEAGRLTPHMLQRLQAVAAKHFEGGKGSPQMRYAACLMALRQDMPL